MRVSFSISNSRELKSFFNQDIDFLDVIVTSSVVYLISNTSELYSHWTFEVTSRENFSGVENFRVHRKNLLAQLADGIVTVYKSQYGSIELSFKTVGGSKYSMEFPEQACDMASIESRMTLLRKQEDFVPLNLSNLNSYMSLLKDMGGVINVIEGMAVAYKDNMQLYCKTKCDDINMTVQATSYVLKFSNRIYGYQNFIIGMAEDRMIAARQIRSSIESDYEIMRRRGASHIIKMNMKPVCELASRSNISEIMVLDFEGRKAFVTDGKNTYSTSFKLNDEDIKSVEGSKEVSIDDMDFSIDLDSFNSLDSSVELKSKHNLPVIEVPVSLLSNLITGANRERVTIQIKKNAIEFVLSKNISVFVGRSDHAA